MYQMAPEAKSRVIKRVTRSGALPVSRDTPGYAAVLGVLGIADTCTSVGGQTGAKESPCEWTLGGESGEQAAANMLAGETRCTQ